MVLVNDVDGEAARIVVEEIRRDGGVAFAAAALAGVESASLAVRREPSLVLRSCHTFSCRW